MSWRTIVISNRAKLDLQLGYLVVRGETVTRIHLSEISIVMIESTAVSLTAALLSELVRQKIKVIFCDEKHNPAAELMPLYGAFDTSSKVRKQVAWAENVKNEIWAEIVRNKIRNQASVLAAFEIPQAAMLEQYACEVKCGDSSNREGHAAKVYFNALFGKSFSRGDDVAINAALDYGYAVLLSASNREIVSNGYITQLGIHHSNVHNQYNLGSDVMECFRPFWDAYIYAMLQEHRLLKFTREEKLQLLNILQSQVCVSGKKYTLDFALKIYIHDLLSVLSNEDAAEYAACVFPEDKE